MIEGLPGGPANANVRCFDHTVGCAFVPGLRELGRHTIFLTEADMTQGCGAVEVMAINPGGEDAEHQVSTPTAEDSDYSGPGTLLAVLLMLAWLKLRPWPQILVLVLPA